jgi:hypothetical protein
VGPGVQYGRQPHPPVNFAWAQHGEEVRCGAHRYRRGFRIRRRFAFTHGPVMSELDRLPGSTLYRHETIHGQNRAFGQPFIGTYVACIALMLAVATLVPAFRGRLFDRIQGYAYFGLGLRGAGAARW